MTLDALILLSIFISIFSGFMWLIITSPNGPPDRIRLSNLLGFIVPLTVALLWSLTFMVHTPEYQANVFYSDTVKNVDSVYLNRNQHLNLNETFGKRVEANTMVIQVYEKPYLNLRWSEKSEYFLKDK